MGFIMSFEKRSWKSVHTGVFRQNSQESRWGPRVASGVGRWAGRQPSSKPVFYS